MSAERKPIRIGGMMRCCIATVRDHTGTDDEGTVLPCAHCSSSAIVSDGAWQWNRAAEVQS